jgi:hypothetical protein
MKAETQLAVLFSCQTFTDFLDSMEIIKWVVESMWPFNIVEDDGFKILMKMGRPEYYILSQPTVAWDVKHMFKKRWESVVMMLQVRWMWVVLLVLMRNVTFQEYERKLSFGTDGWMSPNNKPYVAVNVHFEQDGYPISLLLDLIEVACSHTGVTLAAEFTEVLDSFGIAEKVSMIRTWLPAHCCGGHPDSRVHICNGKPEGYKWVMEAGWI